MGIDRRGLALAVSERPADRGQADPVHDALRGLGMLVVVDAEAGQSDFLPYPDPERVEPIRREGLGEHPRRVRSPWQFRDQPCRFGSEPDGARAGPGIGAPRARTVLADLVPSQVDDFG